MSSLSISRIHDLMEAVSVNETSTTGDAYADAMLIDSGGKSKICVTLENTHAANGAAWKVLASNDGITWVQLKAEAVLAAKGTASWVGTATDVVFRYFKVQAKSTVAATPATLSIAGYAKM